jgi:predicted site-specific integrase-resolvase
MAKVLGLGSEDMPRIGYARVSSHDQKEDLIRQSELLEAFCAAKGGRHEVISDLGSGELPQERSDALARADPPQQRPPIGADP